MGEFYVDAEKLIVYGKRFDEISIMHKLYDGICL